MGDIHEAVEENIGRLMAAGGQGAEEAESPSCGSGDDEGLVEKLDRITSRIPAFKEATEDLKSDLAGLTATSLDLRIRRLAVTFCEAPDPWSSSCLILRWPKMTPCGCICGRESRLRKPGGGTRPDSGGRQAS